MSEPGEKYRKSICNRCKKEIDIPEELWSNNPKDHYCFGCMDEMDDIEYISLTSSKQLTKEEEKWKLITMSKERFAEYDTVRLYKMLEIIVDSCPVLQEWQITNLLDLCRKT